MNAQTFLSKIKPHARPAWGPEVDDLLGRAEQNGWRLDTLAEQVNAALGPQAGTGVAIARLRKLSSINQSIDRSTEGSTATGPCTLGCDHGWFDSIDGHSVVPCRSCRPDTYRRVVERARLQQVGAPQWRIEQAMISEAATGPVPHTYPVGTATP